MQHIPALYCAEWRPCVDTQVSPRHRTFMLHFTTFTVLLYTAGLQDFIMTPLMSARMLAMCCFASGCAHVHFGMLSAAAQHSSAHRLYAPFQLCVQKQEKAKKKETVHHVEHLPSVFKSAVQFYGLTWCCTLHTTAHAMMHAM